MKFKDNVNDSQKDGEIENNNLFFFGNLFSSVFLFFALLLNFMIIIIHLKQKILRKEFFIIIFIQIILEAIIIMSLLLMNIIYLMNSMNKEIEIGIWFVIFPIIFIFSYVTNILYNIRIMIFLMTLDKRKDESFNYGSTRCW